MKTKQEQSVILRPLIGQNLIIMYFPQESEYIMTQTELYSRDESEERMYSYDLFNTDTEQVSVTQLHTPTFVADCNRNYRMNGEPWLWVCTPFVNH